MDAVHPFTLLFVFMLALSTLMRLYLSARQIRHIQAHRGEVPAAFAESISLADHQKAADYTITGLR